MRTTVKTDARLLSDREKSKKDRFLPLRDEFPEEIKSSSATQAIEALEFAMHVRRSSSFPWKSSICAAISFETEDLRRDGFSVLVSLLLEEEEPPRYDVRRIEALEAL